MILALDQEVPKADNGVAGKRSIRVERSSGFGADEMMLNPAMNETLLASVESLLPHSASARLRPSS